MNYKNNSVFISNGAKIINGKILTSEGIEDKKTLLIKKGKIMQFIPHRYLDTRLSKCKDWVLDSVRLLTKKKASFNFKSDGSRVTTADYEIQKFFLKKLRKYFPDDLLCGEENVGKSNLSAINSDKYCWVIDPIDGTNNFVLDIPFFSISVGIFLKGTPKYGIVYDPVHKHLFAARHNAGSWLNGQRLKLKSANLNTSSNLAIRTPFDKRIPEYAQKCFTNYKLRWLGSSALHICYCATGAIAAVIDHKATIWDFAGASLVLLEAGGFFTDFKGKNIYPLSENGKINTHYSISASAPGICIKEIIR
ncbi:MAG: inositol monophosphatase [Desulfurellaceae bacterium]|nr:inositol monophosphatase [Desulfurellaceae bacterium]